MDDFLGQVNGLQFFLIFFLGQFFFPGDIDESGKDCIFLFYVYNVL